MKLVFELERVEVDLDTAVPLALILVELITNAYKHAFPPGRKGRIRVRLRRDGDQARVSVRDNGVGMPAADPRADAIGMRLVGMMAQQIDATLTVENDDGVRATLVFPVRRRGRPQPPRVAPAPKANAAACPAAT